MSEATRMWTEISFNIGYLLAVWALVAMMTKQESSLPESDAHLARPFRWAFVALALGDTSHVGLRVLVFALGDMGTTIRSFDRDIGLVGLGALLTAITVTIFYLLMLFVWKRRFKASFGWFQVGLIIIALARFALMIPAQNQWGSAIPPQPWSLFRNVPLTLLGLGVAYLVLRDARALGDRSFTGIGLMMLVSYAFYIPVILFVQQAPLVGMLMIPKTLAYLVMAWIGIQTLFRRPAQSRPEA
jgi:hypothetical protein